MIVEDREKQKRMKERVRDVRDEVQVYRRNGSMQSSTKLIDEYVAIDQKSITIPTAQCLRRRFSIRRTIRETIGAIPTVVFYSSIMLGWTLRNPEPMYTRRK